MYRKCNINNHFSKFVLCATRRFHMCRIVVGIWGTVELWGLLVARQLIKSTQITQNAGDHFDNALFTKMSSRAQLSLWEALEVSLRDSYYPREEDPHQEHTGSFNLYIATLYDLIFTLHLPPLNTLLNDYHYIIKKLTQ